MRYSISFENDKYLIHGFRPSDFGRFESLAGEVFHILSDEQTLRFIPSKRLGSVEEAEAFLAAMLINSFSEKNFLHFIIEKSSGKVLGMIDLISPGVAREHYRMTEYPFFMEFYLASSASGAHLMTEILPCVVDDLLCSGIAAIGAVVNRKNIAAKTVLKKARFRRKYSFDFQQDLYLVE